jgi:hypothetical protein
MSEPEKFGGNAFDRRVVLFIVHKFLSIHVWSMCRYARKKIRGKSLSGVTAILVDFQLGQIRRSPVRWANNIAQCPRSLATVICE